MTEKHHIIKRINWTKAEAPKKEKRKKLTQLKEALSMEQGGICPICKDPCHREKSARELRIEGHVRRVRKRFEGEHKPKGTIRSRGFQGSRPFPKKDEWKPREPSYWR